MARGRPSKKQVILDAARQLFAESGYQGTSIDLVVQTASVSKPTVYNNFPTKQALLQALLEELSSEVQLQRQAIVDDSSLSVIGRLIAIFRHLATVPEYLAVYRMCYGERHKLDEVTYQLCARFDQVLQDDCKALLHGQKEDNDKILVVIAICRESLLIPALSGGQAASQEVIETALSRVI
ncbi:TetR/AcrR family transcriptional regulator [Neptunomonas japonica]|uniref:TetR/AcrR family transcriptional regulator n=1 Tax=Neptunomonas japonica TaxID=417574 RepID=UPI000421095B|nr:TetR/AcrR family transcriptional regulator [Neptunomonas japonica]